MKYRIFQVAALTMWVEVDGDLWTDEEGTPRAFSTRAQAAEELAREAREVAA
jgi:hypothetical protein